MTTTDSTSTAKNRRGAAPKSQTSPVIVQFQPAPVPDGPRAPKRVEWIALSDEPDHPYAGHQIQARIRYPDTLNTEFSSGDFVKIRAALRKVVLAHNGWVDPDTDELMAPATDDDFWALLAQEEVLLCLRAIGAARRKVLSSLLEGRGPTMIVTAARNGITD
jgi:hypothetical protein